MIPLAINIDLTLIDSFDDVLVYSAVIKSIFNSRFVACVHMRCLIYKRGADYNLLFFVLCFCLFRC